MEYNQYYQISNLYSLLTERKFTDVTFIIGSDQVEFPAIRALVASISPVFEAMLFGNMHESAPNSKITIPDVDANAFQSILDFAYCNDPKITENNVLSVYQISDKYQITELCTLCEKYFNKIAAPTNICSALSVTVSLTLDKLLIKCQEYLSRFGVNPVLMLQSEGFMKMNSNAMKIFLQCNNMNISEDNLWPYVVKWVKKQTQNQKNLKNVLQIESMENDRKNDESEEIWSDYQIFLLKEISEFIRFGAMSPKYFLQNVEPLRFLTEREILNIVKYQIKQEGCCKFSTKSRNFRSWSTLPFVDLVFGDDSDDSDYDTDDAEHDEQCLDQEEDQYDSTEEVVAMDDSLIA